MYIARQHGRDYLLDRIAGGGMADTCRAKTDDARGEEQGAALHPLTGRRDDAGVEPSAVSVKNGQTVSDLRHVGLGRLHPPAHQQQVVTGQASRLVDRPRATDRLDVGHVGRQETGYVRRRQLVDHFVGQRRHPHAQLPDRPAQGQGIKVNSLFGGKVKQNQAHIGLHAG